MRATSAMRCSSTSACLSRRCSRACGCGTRRPGGRASSRPTGACPWRPFPKRATRRPCWPHSRCRSPACTSSTVPVTSGSRPAASQSRRFLPAMPPLPGQLRCARASSRGPSASSATRSSSRSCSTAPGRVSRCTPGTISKPRRSGSLQSSGPIRPSWRRCSARHAEPCSHQASDSRLPTSSSRPVRSAQLEIELVTPQPGPS